MAKPDSIIVPDTKANQYNGSMISIIVGDGETQETFTLHEFHISSYSAFFRCAFRGDFVEAHEKLIRLPTESPTVFRLYLDFIFSGKLPVEPPASSDTIHDINIQKDTIFRRLCPLYILCDMLQDTKAKNAIVDAVIQTSNASEPDYWVPNPDDMTVLFENIGPCPLRTLVVDMWSHLCMDAQNWMGDDAGVFHHQFLFEVCKRIIVKGNRGRPSYLYKVAHGYYFEKPDETTR
ncbi:hypothetical protein EJ04DRAFT_46107 [Polyplosphaeria fusca]|uniref:BTB domain-containing protein n=1 Tax=Polyplosphaeria fusca TaxID=682080 RepID=A0A9P4QRP9_9PLEO|nr:hypothetical protein EJ04DRAFT_46107 [Polyplosphaeria fusca]